MRLPAPLARWGRRHPRSAIAATVLATLTALLLINAAALRWPLVVDLSETGVNSLAPRTVELLRTLPAPLRLSVVATRPEGETRELLDRVRQQGDRLRIADLSLAEGATLGLKVPGDALLQLGDRREPLPNLRQQPLTEARLAEAIQRLRQPVRTVYLLDAALADSPAARQTLEQAGLRLQPLAAGAAVPGDAAALVAVGVPTDRRPLEGYLQRGGSLLLLAAPEDGPALEPLLVPYGLRLLPTPVLGRPSPGLPPETVVVGQLGPAPFLKGLDGGEVVLSRPGALQLGRQPDQQTWPLLLYAADRGEVQPLGAAVERTLDSGSTRLVVIATPQLVSDPSLNRGLNADLWQRSFDWLTRTDRPLISLRTRQPEDRRLLLQEWHWNSVFLLAVVLLPLGAFATAATLAWRQR